MSRRDAHTFVAASAILLAASLVRHLAVPAGGPDLLPPDSAGMRELLSRRSRQAREEQARRARPLGEGERLDPNRAPAPELDRLPGVGPSLARAIVEARERGGPFRSSRDLTRVRGIGSATAKRLAPLVDLPRVSVEGAVSASEGPRDREAGPGRPLTAPVRGEERGRRSPVDLNRADAADLQRLPGIGPALARRVLEHRRRLGGRFRSAEQLLEVRGIGPATLERIRGWGVVPP